MRAVDSEAMTSSNDHGRSPAVKQVILVIAIQVFLCLLGVVLLRSLGFKGEAVIPVACMFLVPEVLGIVGGRPESPVWVYRAAGLGGALVIVMLNVFS